MHKCNKCIIHVRVIPQTISKKVVSEYDVWCAFFIYTKHM